MSLGLGGEDSGEPNRTTKDANHFHNGIPLNYTMNFTARIKHNSSQINKQRDRAVKRKVGQIVGLDSTLGLSKNVGLDHEGDGSDYRALVRA